MTESIERDSLELFELCKQVYHATGWADKLNDTPQMYAVGKKGKFLQIINDGTFNLGELEYFCPLYTSDYLLEKLPSSLQPGNEPNWLSIQGMFYSDPDKWYANYLDAMGMGVNNMKGVFADTPLKALLKLTLALSAAGELSK